MRKLKARGLHDHVIEEIGKSIVNGEFQPGSALPNEMLLSDELGVSRTALREAVRVLADKGLVEPKRKVGTQVRSPEHWNFLDSEILSWLLAGKEREEVIHELYELRHLIEPMAAALAARNAKARDLKALRAAYQELEAAGDDGAKVASPDLAFHCGIIAGSGNRLFSALGHVIGTALSANFEFVRDVPRGHIRSLPAHRKVLEAIERRDAVKARVEMQKLIEDSHGEAKTARTKGNPRRTVPLKWASRS